ncbi:uncharacterized protein LOC112682187 [Sipha flava]|uniref:Uncharacterized protein LOC112682187 n=1 Tax=Sipha flava TaxID=143950 RepID=A0A8B8FD17_9HEMI|nr:uncharacterized protein LOC112682187 [Sipha flava]
MAQKNCKFQTDTAISKYNRKNHKRDEVLDVWVSLSRNDDDMRRFEIIDSGSNNDNGWDVNDMFKRNEIKYGVKSTFDESLKDYTTEINRDASDFKELEVKAAHLAKEIQRNAISQKRAELENCDEEEIFTADLRKNDSRNNELQSPESQQYYSNHRYSQKIQNNRFKYSKTPMNEWQKFVCSLETKNVHRNHGRYIQNYDILNASTPPQYQGENNNGHSVVNHIPPAIVIDNNNKCNHLSNHRYSQKIQNNRYKYSKTPMNEWQKFVAGLETKNVHQVVHDLNEKVGISRCITNTEQLDIVMSCPEVGSQIIVSSDKCDPKSEIPPVPISDDDKNDLEKISTGVTDIQIQEHKDESLLFLNYDLQSNENENIVVDKIQENDVEQSIIDCHNGDLIIQNNPTNQSSLDIFSPTLNEPPYGKSITTYNIIIQRRHASFDTNPSIPSTGGSICNNAT